MERRLAAILVADVVGYSRITEKDEAATFEQRLSAPQELFKPKIAKHDGRIGAGSRGPQAQRARGSRIALRYAATIPLVNRERFFIMKGLTLLASAAAAFAFIGSASADTLSDVKGRGSLICGTNTGLAGFATQ